MILPQLLDGQILVNYFPEKSSTSSYLLVGKIYKKDVSQKKKVQTHWQRQFISVSQPMHNMVNSIRLQEDQNSLKLSSIPMFLVSPNAPCTNSFWSSSLAILAHSFPASYSIFSLLSVTTAQVHHQIDREWKCSWAAGHAQRTGSACSGSCLCWSN